MNLIVNLPRTVFVKTYKHVCIHIDHICAVKITPFIVYSHFMTIYYTAFLKLFSYTENTLTIYLEQSQPCQIKIFRQTYPFLQCN